MRNRAAEDDHEENKILLVEWLAEESDVMNIRGDDIKGLDKFCP